MHDIDNSYAIALQKDHDGTLTIGDTTHSGFYRLLDGEHAGRIIIKTTTRINDQLIVYFADHLTWTYAEDLRTTRCEIAKPTFPPPRHPIDLSHNTP